MSKDTAHRRTASSRDVDEREQIVSAIREGNVDAFVVGEPGRERVHALEDADQSYRIFVENIREGAVTLSKGRDIFYANRSFAELMGLPLRTVIDSTFDRFIAPADRDRFAAFLEEGDDRGDGRLEITLVGADATQVPVSVSRSKAEFGRITCTCLIISDLTENKHVEAVLKRTNAALLQSNRQLQDFVFAASHDLQEPLRKVRTFIDLLRRDSGDSLDQQGRFYLERIQAGSERMMSLIRGLLALSTVRTPVSEFQTVSLEAIIDDVVADQTAKMEAADARIEIGDLPMLECVPVHMRRLFQHLIENALKFRRPDVAPVVRIKTTAERSEVVPGVQNQMVYRISVSDNGVGFDEAYADRIFTSFQRLNPRSGDGSDGTGIGLTICRLIVEMHHGNIVAKSAPGKGTTIIITLPAQQPKLPAPNISRRPE